MWYHSFVVLRDNRTTGLYAFSPVASSYHATIAWFFFISKKLMQAALHHNLHQFIKYGLLILLDMHTHNLL